MHEIMRSNDAVVLSFAQAVLKDFGIANFVADLHVSAVEGSIGAFPRRLLVDADDVAAARQALVNAGLKVWLINTEETGT